MRRDDIFTPSAQDLRPMALESAAHHEECLEAALVDMKNEFHGVNNKHPEHEFRYVAVSVAKHYDALQAIPGYVMPGWLSQMAADVAGLE